MKKKTKGLADTQDGAFVLNESGTSINNPWDAAANESDNTDAVEEEENDGDSNQDNNTIEDDDQAH